MKRALVLIAMTWALAACEPSAPEPTTMTADATTVMEEVVVGDPIETLRPIYAAITAPEDAPMAPPPAPIYTTSLKTLWDAYDARNEEGVGFDPFVNGQDDHITRLDLALEAAPANDAAVVVARFVNFDQPQDLRFDMRLEEGSWRIDNIRSMAAPRWNLREMLTAAH